MPPCPFPPSTLAPSQAELDWLHDWLLDRYEVNGDTGVLEFGAGITTWAICSALSAYDHVFYCAVEDFEPCVENVNKFLGGDVNVLQNWDVVCCHAWNIVFVDSSCGCGTPGLHREMCVKAVEDHQAVDDLLILHDWRKRSGKAARKYLETCGKYQLVDSFDGRTGIGIYRRV